MEIDLIGIFLIGFLGGFGHCVGMCGGFVFTYSVQLAANENTPVAGFRQKIAPHLMYNAGRVLTYVILGEIFGFLGSTLGVVFAMRDFQGGLQLLASLFMILMGVELAGLIPSVSHDYFPGIRGFRRLVSGLFARVNKRNIFGVGVILGFIPCGLVYAAGAKAAATQSMIGGMVTMLVFGLGTFPAMVLTGLMSGLISSRLRRRIYRVAAILVIVLGIVTLLRGLDALEIIRMPVVL